MKYTLDAYRWPSEEPDHYWVALELYAACEESQTYTSCILVQQEIVGEAEAELLKRALNALADKLLA